MSKTRLYDFTLNEGLEMNGEFEWCNKRYVGGYLWILFSTCSNTSMVRIQKTNYFIILHVCYFSPSLCNISLNLSLHHQNHYWFRVSESYYPIFSTFIETIFHSFVLIKYGETMFKEMGIENMSRNNINHLCPIVYS